MNDRLGHERGAAPRRHDRETLESRFALRVAARLSEHAAALPHDVSERLRFARETALERARAAGVAVVVAPQPSRASVAVRSLAAAGAGRGGTPGDGSSGWWTKLASVLPLVVLIGGLLLIQNQHVHQQIGVDLGSGGDLLMHVLVLDQQQPADQRHQRQHRRQLRPPAR